MKKKVGHILFPPLSFQCRLGVDPREREKLQRIELLLELEIDTAKSARTDSVGDTVNYAEVFLAVKKYFQSSRSRLVEKTAESLAERLFKQFPLIHMVHICLSKRPFRVKGLPKISYAIHRQR